MKCVLWSVLLYFSECIFWVMYGFKLHSMNDNKYYCLISSLLAVSTIVHLRPYGLLLFPLLHTYQMLLLCLFLLSYKLLYFVLFRH
jgi:hypothetical protein